MRHSMIILALLFSLLMNCSAAAMTEVKSAGATVETKAAVKDVNYRKDRMSPLFVATLHLNSHVVDLLLQTRDIHLSHVLEVLQEIAFMVEEKVLVAEMAESKEQDSKTDRTKLEKIKSLLHAYIKVPNWSRFKIALDKLDIDTLKVIVAEYPKLAIIRSIPLVEARLAETSFADQPEQHEKLLAIKEMLYRAYIKEDVVSADLDDESF